MKKTMFLIVCLVLAVSGFVSAGAGGEAAASTGAIEVSAPGQFPIVSEKVTLSFFSPQSAIIEDMATNTMTKYMEDLTNVHIEWETVPQQGVNEKRTLLLASGDFPDVLFSAGTTPNE